MFPLSMVSCVFCTPWKHEENKTNQRQWKHGVHRTQYTRDSGNMGYTRHRTPETVETWGT
jgi:hypothetical protein